MSTKNVPSVKPSRKSPANVQSDADAKTIAPRDGVLKFGEVEIPCLTLESGEALLTGRGILRVFAGPKRGDLKTFIARIPGVSSGFSLVPKGEYQLPDNNALATCYPAETLIDICTFYVNALSAGTLHPKQVPLAMRAAVIVGACAKAGITALVWEATGFDKVKGERMLQDKLAAALRHEAGKWGKLFEQEFFAALARLFHLRLDSNGRRPMCFAVFIAEFFYEWFDTDVYVELKRRNPSPVQSGIKHHQHLTDFARERFRAHQRDVLLLLRTSASLDDFRMRFDAAFRGTGLQLSFGGV